MAIVTYTDTTQKTVDSFSLAAVPIKLLTLGKVIGSGTTFGWRKGERQYLITNWHCVSGKDARTGEHMNGYLAEPDSLQVRLYQRASAAVPAANQTLVREWAEFALRDEQGAPLWLEHPEFGNAVDVVALPVEMPKHLGLAPLNMQKNDNLITRIGQDAFVVGYPFTTLTLDLPIWKRASVASEPAVNVEYLPLFYVDTASRPGMSGAPVLRREYMGHHDPAIGIVQSHEGTTKFLGIYSGRLGNDDMKAQLGLVWRASVVDEIIKGQRRGSMDSLWKSRS